MELATLDLQLCSKTWHTNSLVLEVFHQALHVLQLALQLDLLIAKPIQLSAQVGDVGLKHSIDVGTGGGLFLQQLPLGLQHFVLLLQEANLKRHWACLDFCVLGKRFSLMTAMLN